MLLFSCGFILSVHIFVCILLATVMMFEKDGSERV